MILIAFMLAFWSVCSDSDSESVAKYHSNSVSDSDSDSLSGRSFMPFFLPFGLLSVFTFLLLCEAACWAAAMYQLWHTTCC